MRALVTGAAGFIGSRLCSSLLDAGHEVLAVDALTPYYDRSQKEGNLASFADRSGVEIVQADLRVRDAAPFVDATDVVFHLAAQPGVRESWDAGFSLYNEHNVLATQRLLNAARQVGTDRFVFASSSAIYGNTPDYPTAEDAVPKPASPYSATKLAAEHLCGLYTENWEVPTVSLRYFSVYGPHQRPDMAFYRLIEAGLDGTPFELYGNGEQIRDVTYVDDIVSATISAADADLEPGSVLNLSGGSEVSVNEVIDATSRLMDREIHLIRVAPRAGDVEKSGGQTDLARKLLNWAPQVDLDTGLGQQIAWQKSRRGVTT